jgi:TIR domain
MAKPTRDIFVCHASEDKDEVVRPLVEAFTAAGVSCWYDEAEIHWGDSITQKVNEGLASLRFVVVVFSPTFVRKNWPQRELNAVLNQEVSSGGQFSAVTHDGNCRMRGRVTLNPRMWYP